MPEIIIRYYNEKSFKDSYLKIEGILKKIMGNTRLIIGTPHSYKKEGYTEVKCFTSGKTILEKSKLIEKIENEFCKIKGVNKEDFGIKVQA